MNGALITASRLTVLEESAQIASGPPVERRELMAGMHKTMDARASLSARGAKQYHLIFAVGYTICLMLAIAGRLLPRRWRNVPPGARADASVFEEARAMANTYVPFAFMA